MSIIYVLFIYCNHRSILKFILKIISVRHYKKQDTITEMPRYPPQQCTEWHSMAIQEYYWKVQMRWLWEKSCQHPLIYNHGMKYIIEKGDYSHLQYIILTLVCHLMKCCHNTSMPSMSLKSKLGIEGIKC